MTIFNKNNSDEEIARALQEQYQREAAAAGRSSNSSANNRIRLPMASAPPSSSMSTPHNNKTKSSSTPDTVASSTPSPKKKGGTPRTSPRSSPRSSPRNSFSFGGMFISEDTYNDEALARKLDQELRDTELASSLERAHRARSTSSANVTTSQRGRRGRCSSRQLQSPPHIQEERHGCSKGNIVYYATRVIIALLIAGITFIVYITVFGGQSVTDVLDPSSWLPGYPDEDPSLGSVNDHNKWSPLSGETDGVGGLSLQVLNNLSGGSDWDEYLKSSIYEWDHGTPDAVTLNIRSMTYDPECRAVRRAMKVCNANYGPTDWRGVNQILLQDDYIITSLAKMNDYYLEGTNRAQKQYTMCHELGHGLGLVSDISSQFASVSFSFIVRIPHQSVPTSFRN